MTQDPGGLILRLAMLAGAAFMKTKGTTFADGTPSEQGQWDSGVRHLVSCCLVDAYADKGSKSGALHADALMCGVRPDHRRLGAIDSLDADVDVLPHLRRVGPTDDFVLTRLVGELIADLKLHREHPRRRDRR